ncbi:MAG: YbjN domain-containing protein [Actinomycetota bacterium]
MTVSRDDLTAQVRSVLDASGIEYEDGTRPGEVIASLPGDHKLRTAVSLLVGDHSLSASAFVIRRPDENTDRVHAWMLRRNARLQGVAYAIDRDGDVFVVGRLPVAAVTPDAVDALLGAVLDASDSAFDTLLAMGFLTSMRREWAWRVSRGESTRNLDAFRHLLED